jgi:single-strand selective monofunctional uracil DNA glycosylase
MVEGWFVLTATCFRRLRSITDELVDDLRKLVFSEPVTHIYNPLEYAREPYERYLEKYACRKDQVILLGMNPGPWGMVQTGVPFGTVPLVRDWLGIHGKVRRPPNLHPRRPVEGFTCTRSEVSGQRLWGWAEMRFQTPDRFFDRFFVLNYCPLMFIDQDGKNRTPDKLKISERKPLLAACDRALHEIVSVFDSKMVIGIGRFAAKQAATALTGHAVRVAAVTHPSPANPKANRGWAELMEADLSGLGVLPR